jgi:GDP/UDP-N,N'-diacetylbacillosamine 2-epimerase (hydrolysing)
MSPSATLRRIAVVTGTRADYGLLRWILEALRNADDFELLTVVTGGHLLPELGETWRQVEADGFTLSALVATHQTGDRPLDVAKACGTALSGFGEAFAALAPDLVLLLGDRFEVFAAAAAALPLNIPVAHLHGGETTEGAIDEQYRHAITKLSHLHLPAAEAFAKNLRRMGEEPWRVTVVGAPGLEWIRHLPPVDVAAWAGRFRVEPGEPVLLGTFHPATIRTVGGPTPAEELEQWLVALERSACRCIVTGTGADADGLSYNARVRAYTEDHPRISFHQNLGSSVYLDCMRHCTCMVGNSSSGIVEAASFGLPVVDVGDRQKGRLHGENVLHVDGRADAILAGIRVALSEGFQRRAVAVENPYGDGCTSEKVLAALRRADPARLLRKRLVFEDA